MKKKIKTLLIHGDGSVTAFDSEDKRIPEVEKSAQELMDAGLSVLGFDLAGANVRTGRHTYLTKRNEKGVLTSEFQKWSLPEQESLPPKEETEEVPAEEEKHQKKKRKKAKDDQSDPS